MFKNKKRENKFKLFFFYIKEKKKKKELMINRFDNIELFLRIWRFRRLKKVYQY